jgi:hypothetical protein
MAFSVQNDTGTVTDANAYITVTEYRTYWTDRGVDTSSQDDTVVEGLIVQATQYIDTRYQYNGEKLTGRDQTTEFPRAYLYDGYCNLVEGVPREVKNACAEYAYNGATTPLGNTYTASEQGIKKEFDKVDVLETEREYVGAKVSTSTWNIYQVADNILTNSGFVVTQYGIGRA